MAVNDDRPSARPVGWIFSGAFLSGGNEKFWLVVSLKEYWWSMRGGWLEAPARPAFMHLSAESAEREAERLAIENRGTEFAILETTKIVVASRLEVLGGRLQAVPRYEEPR